MPGKGGGEDPAIGNGDIHASGCRAHDGGNWLRWNHAGQGSEGESVDFQHQPLPGHGEINLTFIEEIQATSVTTLALAAYKVSRLPCVRCGARVWYTKGMPHSVAPQK